MGVRLIFPSKDASIEYVYVLVDTCVFKFKKYS